MTHAKADDTRLHSLDALRGVAALAVVFWHWQHFWFQGVSPSAGFDRHLQPLYPVFFLFYNHGDLAVDLFFALSGFIFYRLYAERIAERRVSLRDFAVLRVSRLYPLHLATLLVVAAGQFVYTAACGESFVYRFNDAPHFLLNLLLLPSVGLERSYSFNGPAWSISVEFLLYGVFFALCWFRKVRPTHLLAMAAIGVLVTARVYSPVGRGLTGFFLGGFAYHAYLYVKQHPHARTLSGALIVVTTLLWVATIAFSRSELSLQEFSALSHLPVPALARFHVLALFPLTLLTVALAEGGAGGFFRRLGPLGDISYSSYMWHFPIQLGFVLIAGAVGIGSASFYSAWMLGAFAAVLLTISVLSHRLLEMPAQKRMREMWLSPAGARSRAHPPAR